MDEASVWTPGIRLVPLVNAQSTLVPQAFYGNEGQALFNITNFRYVPNVGSLLVFINGVNQLYGTDYMELNDHQFQLAEGVHAGDLVVAYGFVGTLVTGSGGGGTAGVLSFNTRTGAITLTAADVNTALGYIPGSLTSFNTRAGAITLTYADVITALGFVPDSGASGVATFNTRNGAVTLTSLDVTNALGFTPAQVAGTDTQVQFNDGGAFAGSAKLYFDKTTGSLTSDLATDKTCYVLKTQSAAPTGNSLALGIKVTGAHEVIQTDNYKNTSVQTYSTAYYSRRTIQQGNKAGAGPFTQHFGLFHDVSAIEECSDAAAVVHHFLAAGTNIAHRAETSTLSYFHKTNSVGPSYSSIAEGTQQIEVCAANTSAVGLQSTLNVFDGALANVLSYYYINVNNASPTFRADSFNILQGKWKYLFQGFNLDVNTCGLDLYSGITWAASIPAIKLSKNTILDFRGEDPGQYYMRADTATNSLSTVVGATGVTTYASNLITHFVNTQLTAGKTFKLTGTSAVPSKVLSVDGSGNLLVANNAGTPILSLADTGALSTLNFGLASVPFVSSIASATGTFTAAAINEAQYMLCGKLCFFSIKYTITTVGSAADGLILGLPFTSIAGAQILCNASGVHQGGLVTHGAIPVAPSAFISVGKYDGTTVCTITGIGKISGFFEHNQL